MTTNHNSKTGSFLSLNPPLTPWVADVVTAMGFSQMTPVQANTIPLFMQNKDVVVEAVTGSGKTLSFLIPILEKVLSLERKPKSEIRAIVVSPTRELATQIFEVLSAFLRCHPAYVAESPDPAEDVIPEVFESPIVKAMLLIGGTGASSVKKDLTEFRENGADILVATPGRLEEFLLGYSSLSKGKQRMNSSDRSGIGKAHINLKGLEVLVLDEADRLLDLGFAPVLTNIISHLPKQRRTGLFSATLLNDGLTELIKVGLRNPVKVVVKTQTNKQLVTEEDRGPSGLLNYFVEVPKVERKMSQLIRLLNHMILPKPRGEGSHKFIVYMSTCACVDYYYKILSKLSDLEAFSIHSLHAQQSPTRRSATYNSFKLAPLSKPTLLLCTDLVARGLDLPDIDVVIQYDPPKDVRNFFHRIGRTARAGRNGKAFVFLHRGRETDYVDYMKLKKIVLEPFPYLFAATLVEGNKTGAKLRADGRCSKTKHARKVDNHGPQIPAPEDDEDADALNRRIKAVVKTDRDLHDRAVNAFVSFIRFYSKHEASYIFQLKHLDLPQLGFETFGLIRLPKMPELKEYQGPHGSLTSEGFRKEGDGFNWSEYRYIDPIKEQNRLDKQKVEQSRPPKSIEAVREASALTPVNQKLLELKAKKLASNVAWSNQQNKKLNKEQRRLKRIRANEPKTSDDVQTGGKDDDDDDDEADWKELIRENKTLQRLKRQKQKEEEEDNQPEGLQLARPEEAASGFFDGLA